MTHITNVPHAKDMIHKAIVTMTQVHHPIRNTLASALCVLSKGRLQTNRQSRVTSVSVAGEHSATR